jgi:hypothetical protein
VHAALEALERGAPALVEGDDLAVEHGVALAQRVRKRGDLRVARGHVVEVAALEPEPAVLDVRDRADAVPLDLVRPAAVVRRQLRQLGEHRDEPLGHGVVGHRGVAARFSVRSHA